MTALQTERAQENEHRSTSLSEYGGMHVYIWKEIDISLEVSHDVSVPQNFIFEQVWKATSSPRLIGTQISLIYS